MGPTDPNDHDDSDRKANDLYMNASDDHNEVQVEVMIIIRLSKERYKRSYKLSYYYLWSNIFGSI